MRGHISAHAVCTAIRDDIVSGALAPGSRLVEEILAARYGVSRVPVREALRTLQSEGFVTTRHHAGACVAEPSEQEAADLLDIRALLEPLGAARAAARRSPAHLKVLRGLVRLGRERARHGNLADLRQLDGWFHETLAQAAGSPSCGARSSGCTWWNRRPGPASPGTNTARCWTRWPGGTRNGRAP